MPPKKSPTHNYIRDKATLTAAGTASHTFNRPVRNVPVDIHSVSLTSSVAVPFPDANAFLGELAEVAGVRILRPHITFGHVTIPDPLHGYTWKMPGGKQDWDLNQQLRIWITSCRACVITFIVEWSYRE